jgi:hypothetical protein
MDCRIKSGNDDEWDLSTEIIMTAIWDKAFLKQRKRDLRDDALAVQSDEDWESAVLQLEQGMSNASGGFRDCPLSVCRRAHRCVGNRPICMPRCKVELVPGGEQELVEEFYADIQQERRDAAAENRAAYVERVMRDRVHVEDDEIEDEPSAKPAAHEPERSLRIVSEAQRHDDAPSRLTPQPELRKPEPPAPPAAPAAIAQPPVPAAPPAPAWEPQISPEAEERINQIWADYVAGKPMPRPEPRIRSLSDDTWSLPPQWQGRR